MGLPDSCRAPEGDISSSPSSPSLPQKKISYKPFIVTSSWAFWRLMLSFCTFQPTNQPTNMFRSVREGGKHPKSGNGHSRVAHCCSNLIAPNQPSPAQDRPGAGPAVPKHSESSCSPTNFPLAEPLLVAEPPVPGTSQKMHPLGSSGCSWLTPWEEISVSRALWWSVDPMQQQCCWELQEHVPCTSVQALILHGASQGASQFLLTTSGTVLRATSAPRHPL